MSEKFVRAISAEEIAPGGMKFVEIDGKEIVICHCGATFFAIQRRCGHMNAPLEMGTLDGKYLTCPMHCAQFDVESGQAISGPVPPDFGGENPPPVFGEYLQNIGMIMAHVRTESILTYSTKLEDGWVMIAL